MNPVCTKCHVEMRCKKSGVSVAPAMMEHYHHVGDEFVCDACGATIAVNFGEPFNSDVEPDVVLMETE
jgi:hypothetical protein